MIGLVSVRVAPSIVMPSTRTALSSLMWVWILKID